MRSQLAVWDSVRRRLRLPLNHLVHAAKSAFAQIVFAMKLNALAGSADLAVAQRIAAQLVAASNLFQPGTRAKLPMHNLNSMRCRNE